ncbi:MAG: Coenzyme F420 hydrogenase/dehydrogenase, beta subunit C-terminal domain [Candidatus Hodarchaeota archaeon]
MVEQVSFEKVLEEVIKTGKCTNCSACEAICFLSSKAVISHDDKFNRIYDTDGCDKCGYCYTCCPRSNFRESENASILKKNRLGDYISIGTYKTSLDELKDNYQDGGMVTSLLLYLLDKDLIDAALITRKLENWVPETFITNDRDEIINSAGTIYATYPIFDALKALHDLEGADLEKFGVSNADDLRVCMVGLPCTLAALHNMEALEVFPANLIKVKIGLFCYENFDHDVLFNKKLKSDMKIPLEKIKSMNIKGNMIITLKDGKVIELKPEEFQPLAREGCHWCDDLTSLHSDISCGGIGADQGYTSVVIRTNSGLDIVQRAMKAGYVEQGPPSKAKLMRIISRKKMKKQKKD